MFFIERRVAPALLLLSLFLAAPALAQDGSGTPGSPTEKQERLNEDGVRALADGDYVKAIAMLEESLYLGEFNIAYLNLGRAYQLAGRCADARKTLQKVEGAPPVEEPSAGFINAKAEQYLEQLEESCGEAPPAGDEMADSDESTETPAVSAPADSESSRSQWGVIATSTGGVMMASAVGMHFLWAESIRDDARNSASGGIVRDISQQEYVDAEGRANSVDTAALITGITGGLVTGVGLYLWLSDEGPTQHTLRITPGRGRTSVTYRLRF